MSQAEAEARAFECTVIAWLNHHPVPENGPDQCAYCGGAATADDALPYLNGGGYVWLHGANPFRVRQCRSGHWGE